MDFRLSDTDGERDGLSRSNTGTGTLFASPACSVIDSTDDNHLDSEILPVADELGLNLPSAADILGPTLDVDAVLEFFSSDKPDSYFGSQVNKRVAGTGLAPWEIHRPQAFLRNLVMAGRHEAFSGRILDAGCGIGDNALYIATSCPNASVTSVDVVPRCLDFCAAKARLRGMTARVTLVAADMTEYDSLPLKLRTEPYDVVLDSSLFNTFSGAERLRYMSTLWLLVRRGGVVIINAVSEHEVRQGVVRRVKVSDVQSVFSEANGWQVESVEESVVEMHPRFWEGKGRSRVYTIRKL